VQLHPVVILISLCKYINKFAHDVHILMKVVAHSHHHLVLMLSNNPYHW